MLSSAAAGDGGGGADALSDSAAGGGGEGVLPASPDLLPPGGGKRGGGEGLDDESHRVVNSGNIDWIGMVVYIFEHTKLSRSISSIAIASCYLRGEGERASVPSVLRIPPFRGPPNVTRAMLLLSKITRSFGLFLKLCFGGSTHAR